MRALLVLAAFVGALGGYAPGRVSQQPKAPLKTYNAAGPGHSVKSIGAEGRTVTLEDSSVWSVDPRTQFKVASWETDALITVVLTKEDPDFNYILNNDDVDDWTFATLVSQK
jgi:hypothetical protein